MTSVTIQRFHEDVEAAERASDLGPVFITSEDGKSKKVLIDIADFRRLSEASQSSEPLSDASTHAESLAVPENEYFEWEPERLYFTVRPVDFD